MQQGPLTLFSWGYWGWGNATRQLVQAMDVVEAAHGYAPPIFVDIRISRAVRAAGFSGNAFAAVVGEQRYLHEPDLGNLYVKSKKGPRIQIRNPDAAGDLLELALTRAKRKRRLIFFCSCPWPVWPEDGEDCHCHRVEVGALVLNAAKESGTVVEIAEWPGVPTDETSIEVPLSPRDYGKARASASIPLGDILPTAELLGLPWGSRVDVRAGSNSSSYLAGPAQFSAGRWTLPKCQDEAGRDVSPEDGPAAGAKWRHRWGFEPRRSGTA